MARSEFTSLLGKSGTFLNYSISEVIHFYMKNLRLNLFESQRTLASSEKEPTNLIKRLARNTGKTARQTPQKHKA